MRRAPGAKKTGSDKASFKNLFIEKEFQGTFAHDQPSKTPDLVQPPKFYIRPNNEVNMKISTRKHSRQSALALSTRIKSQDETEKFDLGAGDPRNSADIANSKQIKSQGIFNPKSFNFRGKMFYNKNLGSIRKSAQDLDEATTVGFQDANNSIEGLIIVKASLGEPSRNLFFDDETFVLPEIHADPEQPSSIFDLDRGARVQPGGNFNSDVITQLQPARGISNIQTGSKNR